MMSVGECRAWVKRRIPADRFAHSSRVTELAVRLAHRYGVDGEKARLAGLLHDCARDESPDRLHQLAAVWQVPVTDLELRAPILLHGPIGAELARRECGVEDTQVLDAIRFHTTGRPGMSPVEKIIFVADYAEPGRDFPGVERVRAVLFECLDEALRLTLDQSLSFLLARGFLLHPDTVAARNAQYM